MAVTSHAQVRLPGDVPDGLAGGSTPRHRMKWGRGGIRRALRAVAIWAALGNLALVVAATVLLRAIGEAWWVTALLTYSPRMFLALPLLLTVPLLVWLGPRPLLWTQAATLLVWLFPLMGFNWALEVPAASGPTMRLLTYNAALLRGGALPICEAVLAHDADVIVLQEANGERQSRLVSCLSGAYPEVHSHGEFLMASRFPVRAAEHVQAYGERGEAVFVRATRYELETPVGSLALYSVHPSSPRAAVAAMRRNGLRRQLRTPNLFGGYAAERARKNVSERELQFVAASREAAQEPGLVVVAGDTNLPGLSPVIASNTQRFEDGFEEAGKGFGYTYPSRAPFVRIDRIFADRRLAFNSFATGCGQVSDHLCLVADLSLKPESERREWLSEQPTDH